jgi:flagellar motility protein MotE (MotC chaperone)
VSGYDQFFKKAKDSKSNTVSPAPKIKTKAKARAEESDTEAYLRTALRVKTSKAQRTHKTPVMAIGAVLVGLCVAAAGVFYPVEAEKLLSRLEVRVFSSGLAAGDTDSQPAGSAGGSAKGAGAKETGAAGTSDGKAGAMGAECVQQKGFSEEELSHFNKLNERKQELDRREAELNLLEEELHKQKSEVESRIAKLEEIRNEVANVLKDRVEMDQQRVTTLVEFYSNMKPKQAAEVFATLNEDLAVEVLGRMKKKNAADILNLLEPAKARALSEKFTGYKRR